MRPTYATKRTRARSDPGVLPPNQDHLEMQPIISSQRVIAQSSSQQDIVLPVTITLDSHTVPSTAIPATAEAKHATTEAANEWTSGVPLQLRNQHYDRSRIVSEHREILPEAVVEAFRSSNHTEREAQPSTDGTCAPGQEENSRPTGTTPNPNIHSVTIEDDTSDQRDTTASPIGSIPNQIFAEYYTLEDPAPDQERFFQK